MKASSSTVINVPIEKVFTYATNPENFDNYISCVNQVYNVSPSRAGLGQKFDWIMDIAGTTIGGMGEVSKFESPNHYEIKTSGGANTVWKFNFREIPEGTLFELTLEYNPPNFGSKTTKDDYFIEKFCLMFAQQIVQNLKVIKESRNG